MRRECFRKGLEIKWRNRHFIIEHRNEDGDIQIRDTSSNEYLNFPDSHLIDALFEGELEIIRRNLETHKEFNFVDDLSLLTDSRRDEAKRRYSYVQRCIDRQLNRQLKGATKKHLIPIIREVSQEIKDNNSPSWLTVYRCLKAYIKSDQDIRSLVPQNKKGNTLRRFGKNPSQKLNKQQREIALETAKIVDEVINESFLSKQRLSIQATYDLLLIKISEINRFRQLGDKLPIPHQDSIYTIISKIDDYEKDSARLGKRIADQRYAQRGLGPRPTRPLERTEIDHTKLDEVVIDDNNWLPWADLGLPR